MHDYDYLCMPDIIIKCSGISITKNCIMLSVHVSNFSVITPKLRVKQAFKKPMHTRGGSSLLAGGGGRSQS